MKQISRLSAIVLAIILVAFAGCKKSENNSSSSSSGGGGSTTSDVRVTTYTPQNITGNSAVCGGDVIVTQGLSLTEIGVCWNTEGEPMASDNYLSTEVWNEPFVCTMTGLSPVTKYYVRAYALRGLEYYYGEEKTFTTLNAQGTIPTVITSEVSELTGVSAVCGGNVISDGNCAVTARGVCWSTTHMPTTEDYHTIDGTGVGVFTSSLIALSSQTRYYVRAYATNEKGTSYGEQKTFITTDIPGTLPGVFSISDTQQVYFSQGNLQYQASTNTWRFAENQWDIIGSENSNISENYGGWIDLFGWGTSGYSHGAVCYQPYSTSTENSDYYAYGSAWYNLNDQTGKADWGYNAISNGGNATNNWRTLTRDEWVYVFNTRSTISGIRYAKAQVNGVNGMILFPDDLNSITYSLNSTNTPDASFTANTITSANWSVFEQAGAVFLPAAGCRIGTSVEVVGSYGIYWSASYWNSDAANHVHFGDDCLSVGDYFYYRRDGRSVRLVCSAEN